MLSAGTEDWHEMEESQWELVRDGDRAILIRLEDGEEHWLPKSQIEFDGEKRLSIKIWLARKIGVTEE
jgi:hypothetical protein